MKLGSLIHWIEPLHCIIKIKKLIHGHARKTMNINRGKWAKEVWWNELTVYVRLGIEARSLLWPKKRYWPPNLHNRAYSLISRSRSCLVYHNLFGLHIVCNPSFVINSTFQIPEVIICSQLPNMQFHLLKSTQQKAYLVVNFLTLYQQNVWIFSK